MFGNVDKILDKVDSLIKAINRLAAAQEATNQNQYPAPMPPKISYEYSEATIPPKLRD